MSERLLTPQRYDWGTDRVGRERDSTRHLDQRGEQHRHCVHMPSTHATLDQRFDSLRVACIHLWVAGREQGLVYAHEPVQHPRSAETDTFQRNLQRGVTYGPKHPFRLESEGWIHGG